MLLMKHRMAQLLLSVIVRVCVCERDSEALRVGVGGGGRAVAATLKGSTVFASVGVDIWTALLIPHGCTVFSQLQCKCVRTEHVCRA